MTVKKTLKQRTAEQQTPTGTVAVYTFHVWDKKAGNNVVSPRMAIPDTIRRLKGMADLESKRIVDASAVDAEGFYS
jgi:hypothetical protein